VLGAAGDEPFRDLLTVAIGAGFRCEEIIRVQASQLDRVERRCVLPPSRAKGRKRTRIIYIPDTDWPIVEK
jgi:hypothetical protein